MAKTKFETFVESLKKGDLERVRNNFEIDFLENIIDGRNWRPIHWACWNDHINIAKFLIDKKCNIESENNWKRRPIHFACRNGSVEMVKLLIDQKCNIESEDNEKMRPIHYACLFGFVEMVKLLIDQKCNLESETKRKQRPIHFACFKGRLEKVKLLFAQGCQIEVRNGIGYAPIHYASENGHKDIVKLLIEKGCNVDVKNIIGDAPIYLSLKKGHKDIVKLLIEKGCNIDVKDWYGKAPIHYASKKGHIDIVKLLVNGNCDINCLNKDGCRPINIASYYGHIDIVKFFLEQRCVCEELDENERNALLKGTDQTSTEALMFKLKSKGLVSCTKDKSVGEGSSGEVFKAKEERFKRKVAIKVTSREETGANESKSIERNLDKCLKSLKHRNIVEYYLAVDDEKNFYLYMEYIEGNSLSEILKDHGPISYEEIVSYSKQILEALKYLHGNAIIHRDIKPNNILVTFFNEVKLCDLGLSRILVERSEDMNKYISTSRSSNLNNFQQTTSMGTPNYQAPEVHIEGKSYFVSDIWSFGVTLIEMKTGKSVTESIPDWKEIMRGKKKIDLKPLKDLPDDMFDVLNKALHPDPSLRSSATELLQCDMFTRFFFNNLFFE